MTMGHTGLRQQMKACDIAEVQTRVKRLDNMTFIWILLSSHDAHGVEKNTWRTILTNIVQEMVLVKLERPGPGQDTA